jgi:uncharacterized membrane protein
VAGVGLQLRRLLASDSYAGLLGAYGYAGLISCGPWVLSIAGMLAMGLLAGGGAAPAPRVTELLVAIAWSTAASLLLTGPLQLVLGRYVADRLYERRPESIVANLLGALHLTTVASGALGALVVFATFPESLLCRVLLVAGFVILSDGWILLVLLSGVKAYRAVTAVFLAAQLCSVGGAAALRRHGLEGLLAGWVSGQAVGLFGMLVLVLRALPGARTLRLDFLRPGQARYELAAIGLAFYLGTWADKIVFWLGPGTSAPVIGPLRASVLYDLPIFLAYLSGIPAMAVFFLRLEADFARRCEAFVDAVRDGAPLGTIERVHEGMVACVRRGLVEILQVQGITLAAVLATGPAILRAAGLSPLYLRLLMVDAAGVALQVIFLGILNVLFYLDERWPALALSAAFAGGNLGLSLLTLWLGPDFYGFGFAAASLVASTAGLLVLSRKLERLDRDTYLRQPLWTTTAVPAEPSRRPVVKQTMKLLSAAVISLSATLAGTALADPSDRSPGVNRRRNPPREVRRGPVDHPRVPTRPLPPISPPGRRSSRAALPPGCTSVTLEMRILVVSADGQESTLGAIREALDYHSVPYSVWIATRSPGALTAGALASGCDGRYQGVILATGALAYTTDGGATWASALSAAEWQALRDYERWFGVREISWYVYPGADQGLSVPTREFDTSATPHQATLTAAGAAAFPSINAATPIPITYAWTYLANAADPSVTPLLVDSAGSALVSVRTAGGRETLAMTFDSNQYLLHHAILAHGLVEWVTRGVYLGEFRTYLTPQVDDLYLDNDMHGGGTYRMTAADVSAMHQWQTSVQATPRTAGFRLAFAFNGSGSARTDPLTLALAPIASSYLFINHTFTHLNLNAAIYAEAVEEIGYNDVFARGQGYPSYSTASLVTPDVSGLTNANALRAAKNMGVRYTVSDTSQPGWNNPAPNIGIYSTLEPAVLHIPRRPTNLFVHVATPQQWTAAYNEFYAAYWGRNLTFEEILDKESQFLLLYMLRGDLDPQMYHQANLRAYDGVRSLLSCLHDLAFDKYARYSNLPVLSPDMHVVGERMADTMARNMSGLTARLHPGVGITFHSPVAVRFPVSGVCASNSEIYAGKCITTVNLPAGQATTVPLQP